MSETWLDFFEGKIDANAVLEKYKKWGFTDQLRSQIVRSAWNPGKAHGFDANQSVPGNMLWEELYAASPKGQKVLSGHWRSQKVIM